MHCSWGTHEGDSVRVHNFTCTCTTLTQCHVTLISLQLSLLVSTSLIFFMSLSSTREWAFNAQKFDSFLRQIYALWDCFCWLSRKRNFVALKRWLKHSLGCSGRRVTTDHELLQPFSCRTSGHTTFTRSHVLAQCQKPVIVEQLSTQVEEKCTVPEVLTKAIRYTCTTSLAILHIHTKGRWKKICTNSHKKRKGGGSANAPHCARSASDRAPFLQMLRMRLLMRLGLLIWRQRLNMLKQACSRHLRWQLLFWRQKHACSRHLDSWVFSFDFEFELTLARCSSFMLAHG